MPLAKTRLAASGSCQMLNSATGVTFPVRAAPPIITNRSIIGITSGNLSAKCAMFVSGPIAIKVTGSGELRIFSARNAGASVETTFVVGSGRSTPANPS